MCILLPNFAGPVAAFKLTGLELKLELLHLVWLLAALLCRAEVFLIPVRRQTANLLRIQHLII